MCTRRMSRRALSAHSPTAAALRWIVWTNRPRRRRPRHRWRALAVRDEHVFPAVTREWLTSEAAIQCLQLEAGNVEKPEPFVLCCPPHGAPTSVVEEDVDPVVAHRVFDRVRNRRSCRWPSRRAAMWWSKANAFQAKRPSGCSYAATRSNVRRRSAQVGKCRSARNGQ